MGFQLPTSTGDHRISEPSTEGVYFTQFLLQIQDETMTFLCWEGVKGHVMVMLVSKHCILYGQQRMVYLIGIYMFSRFLVHFLCKIILGSGVGNTVQGP